MGHYLKGKTLEYFAKHMTSCVASPGYYVYPQLEIKTDSKESASSIGSVVKSTFKGRSYFIAPKDEKMVYVTFPKGDESWRRTYAVEQINKEVDAYKSQNTDSLLSEPDDTDAGNADDKGEDTTTDSEKTVYIVIGLAVAVIVAILLFWEKKK